jgi:hypothetical protein
VPASVATTPPDAGAPPNDPSLPTLDALAARGEAEITRMREVLRAPEAAAHPAELEAKASDACFRAIVAANVPVLVHFEDEARVARGESGHAGLVPPRGPACARKGERLRLVVERENASDAETSPVFARAVVWQSP